MNVVNMTNAQLALYLAINDKYYVTQTPNLVVKRADFYLNWLDEKDKLNK